MAKTNVRCTVLQVTGLQGTGDHAIGEEPLAPRVTEIPPWADPVIAQLANKYRYRAALEDSLRFLQNDASYVGGRFAVSRESRPNPAHRFIDPLDQEAQNPGDSWPW